jgi:hypothetical protein
MSSKNIFIITECEEEGKEILTDEEAEITEEGCEDAAFIE